MASLIWGVRGFYYNDESSIDKTIADIQGILEKEGCLKKDDFFINVTSMPFNKNGKTNTIKVSQV